MRDDEAMFERFCLEAFQSGLSWLTILRKRAAFRAAFAGFDLAKVAAFGPQDRDRLLADAGIVRNRAKIDAAINNARAALSLPDGLSALVWRYAADDRPAPVTLADVRLDTRLQGAVPRAQAGRLHLHRPGDGLRGHAGHRGGQRPPARLRLPRLTQRLGQRLTQRLTLFAADGVHRASTLRAPIRPPQARRINCR